MVDRAGQVELLVNGRFLSRPSSGVGRVAAELVRALDVLTRDRSDVSLSLAIPGDVTDAQLAVLADVAFVATYRGRTRGQIWEQLELCRSAPRATLLSLANMGPVLRRDHLVMIHDAQVYLAPRSYSWAFRTWYRFAHPVLGRRARMVVTNSRYSLAQLERFGVVPAGKASIVDLAPDHFNAIEPDVTTLARHGLIADQYILAIGNLAPHKNLAMLMRAAVDRPPGAPELVIAGGANARVFRDAGLVPPPGVRLLGRVSDAELKALYANAALFVFPSLTEGFGLPPLEAMACGCPVIASSAGAIPEVCGDAAWLVDPHDQRGWTEAMVALRADDERRAGMVRRGTLRAGSFTWEASAVTLLRRLGLDRKSSCRS